MATGWKTFWFNLIIKLVGVLEVTDWASLLGSDKAGYVLLVIGFIGQVLRAMTSTPMFKSD